MTSTLDFNPGFMDLKSHLLLYLKYISKSDHSVVSLLTAQISHFTVPSHASHLTHSFGIECFRTQIE